jgi:hypothetical protein
LVPRLGGRRPPRLDEFLESYELWRDRSAAVRIAYVRWTEAEPIGRAFAFAAYGAALDREERAAQVHRACAERLRAEAA